MRVFFVPSDPSRGILKHPPSERMAMDIQILSNGNLQLRLEDGEADELKINMEERNEDMLMAELIEPYSTNSSFSYFNASDANPFVGLTSAPCIAESLHGPDEDGKIEAEGRLWWFPDYAVRSVVEELVERGQVVFPLAPGYEAQPQQTQSRKAPGPGR